jgi:hypothetical protein
MRKFFLYFLAALVLSSCDNLKTKDKTTSDDEEVTPKKKKALSEDESDEEETPRKKKPAVDDGEEETPVVRRDNTDDEESTDGWSRSERKKFLDECVANVPANVGTARGKAYCSCLLEKVEKKYSSYTQAGRMTEVELGDWAAECNQQ